MHTLSDTLKGRIVVVGIGNVLRGDDAAGPEVIRRLQGRQPDTCLLIDAGEVPENHLERIVRFNPDTILLIDAVDFKEAPGSLKLVDWDRLTGGGLSTHNSLLSIVIKYLKNETEAAIVLLGIQPLRIDMMAGLSDPVKQSITKIVEVLQSCMN